MEIPFPAIHLYVVVALAATLASLVSADLRSPGMWGRKMSVLMASGTLALLFLAWGHLILVLLFAGDVREDPVAARHLEAHSLIIATMLPFVCATVFGSWRSGVKKSVQP